MSSFTWCSEWFVPLTRSGNRAHIACDRSTVSPYSSSFTEEHTTANHNLIMYPLIYFDLKTGFNHFIKNLRRCSYDRKFK
jgi:hypothetical protein